MDDDQPERASETLLADLREQLVADYAGTGGRSESEVRDTIQIVEKHFADATVHSFLPILVDREVRARLGPLPEQRRPGVDS